MQDNVFKEAKISLYILSAVLACAAMFYFIASMFTNMGYEGYKKAKKANYDIEKDAVTIIIDAGHGGEDPGAVANGLIEKELNLKIAKRLQAILSSNGYQTVMTRTEDNLLYNQGEEDHKKYYDLRNREAIAEGYENSVFVSIHLNKFPAEYCKGLQAFYSENNEESLTLSETIQSYAKILQTDNKRNVKNGTDTIYLLENLDMPAVLIECGFLSNYNEAQLLKNDEYINALAMSIYCGIADYLEFNQ